MFKIGEFAKLQGQVVEILDIKLMPPSYNLTKVNVKIRLTYDNLTHWVSADKLTPIDQQKTPKVLYSKNK